MPDHKNIKRLIWLYLILLIFEGALRKWVFPSAADALLVVRDPVVLLIYALAIARGVFPVNRFVIVTGVLAFASVAASFIAHQMNPWVLLYGLRINYLHLPLIWVMGAVLDRRDVERIGSFVLLIAIPMTLVMVEQFRSPMNALINRGVGDAETGGQLFGADGRIRPPGFFSFISGPQLFYPLATAFFLLQATRRRRLPWLVLIAAGLAIAVALPVSISRTVMLATGLVGAAFACTLPFTSQKGGAILRTGVIGLVLLLALSQLPIFQEGREVFMKRWQTASSGSEGDALESVSNRTFGAVVQPLRSMARAKFFGAGVGVGSNVGARLLSGKMGFLLAEDEWTKIVLELGPVLGGAFIIFRVWLTVWLALLGLRALFWGRDPLPILLFAACGAAVFIYQWGPPTLLGFAVIGAGLTVAAAKPEVVTVDTPEAGPVPVATPEPVAVSDRRPPAHPKLGTIL